jgi:cardiolipin synthase (CMP-forming)
MTIADVWRVPNLISLSRLVMAGLFLVMRTPEARVLILALAMLSDVLDGFVARISKSATRIGALIDPIADRIFMLVAFIAVAMDSLIEPWQLALLLLRDVMTVIGWFVARNVSWLRQITFRARWPGKGVTVLQFATLLAAIVSRPLVAGLSVAAGVLAVVATVDYTLMLWDNRAGGPRDVTATPDAPS